MICINITYYILFVHLLQHYCVYITFTENDKKEIDRVKQVLNKTFKIMDLGDLQYFLVLK